MTDEILVYASILGGDLANLASEVKRVEEAGADALHLDVMDGHFVPNLTFGPPVIKALRRYTSLPMHAHLMVTNPWDYIKPLAQIGVQEVTFHIETTPHPIRLIREIREAGLRGGIAISPATPENNLIYLEDEIDILLVMSVEPGFAGQSFIESIYGKLKRIKEIVKNWKKRPLIMVDGGVSDRNAKKLIELGVRGLVCASYLFKAENMKEAIDKLKNL